VVGYGPFSLCVIHKEGLCPSIGDINRLMMMMMKDIFMCYIKKCVIYFKVYKYVFIRYQKSITQAITSAYCGLDNRECECLQN
jgi:hypothetical protein